MPLKREKTLARDLPSDVQSERYAADVPCKDDQPPVRPSNKGAMVNNIWPYFGPREVFGLETIMNMRSLDARPSQYGNGRCTLASLPEQQPKRSKREHTHPSVFLAKVAPPTVSEGRGDPLFLHSLQSTMRGNEGLTVMITKVVCSRAARDCTAGLARHLSDTGRFEEGDVAREGIRM